MNEAIVFIGVKITYLLIAGFLLWLFARIYLLGKSTGSQLNWLIGFRLINVTLLTGYILLVVYLPLWVYLLKNVRVFPALLFDDALNLGVIFLYLLFMLYQSYLIEQKTRFLTGSFGSYLLQYGYYWLFIVNILIFLRLDYYYLPLIPNDLDGAVRGLIELGIIALVVIMQFLVYQARGLKMTKAGPEIEGLIREVAKKFKIQLKQVKVWHLEREANAFATGVIYKSLFLTDTLIESASAADLRMIVGHECAHFKLHHLELRVLLAGILIYLGFSLVEDYPELPLAVFAVFGLMGVLIYKAVSRAQEFQADRLAAKTLGNGSQMATALTRVFGVNAVPTNFGKIIRLLIGHPDLRERVKRLERV